MYCLDTNIIIDFWRNDGKIVQMMATKQTERLFITPITLCELYRGAYLSSKREKNLRLIEELLQRTDLLSFPRESCEHFGKESARMKMAGKQADEPDIAIASIAKAHGMIIITRNKKHFEGLGAQIEAW